jgi:hypothetical protein
MSACRRCQSPLEPGDLRCAICALATAPHHAPAGREPVRILRCDGCGAALAYVAEAGAPKCAFCASIMRVEQPSDPLEVAGRVLPFSVPPERAEQALKGWLSSVGFFRPSNLAAASTLEGLRAIFWCGWLVDADALVSWAADSNAGARSAAWAPHAGQNTMRFDRLIIPASRGLKLDECARLTAGYDLSGLVAADRATGAALVEQFDVQRSAARSIVVGAIEQTAAARLVREGHIPGTNVRNVHASVLLRSLRTERVALCAYVLAYRYKGKSYRAVVHGQDARYTFGQAPYSVGKIALVVLGGLFALALLAFALASGMSH